MTKIASVVTSPVVPMTGTPGCAKIPSTTNEGSITVSSGQAPGKSVCSWNGKLVASTAVAGVVAPGAKNVTVIDTGISPMLTTLSLMIVVLRVIPDRVGTTATETIVDPAAIAGVNAVKGNVASATFCTAFEPTTELTRTQSLFNGAASSRAGDLKLHLQAEAS
ncbi:hypothetical protein IOC57_22475 [Bacillus sp. SD075]|uniref:hypothetical protein n=1 Tax=Bacillus sp. SD075 TaxID=2781732 RepID=UPI001A979609|nr:hypothetical protein [Bacillus sp. SD075]MBO1000494.1 hypothetical protein [Bacillus sp. SD075]